MKVVYYNTDTKRVLDVVQIDGDNAHKEDGHVVTDQDKIKITDYMVLLSDDAELPLVEGYEPPTFLDNLTESDREQALHFHRIRHSMVTDDILAQDLVPDLPVKEDDVNEELEAVRRAVRVSIAKLIRADELTDEELSEMVAIYPLFSAGVAYDLGYIVRYEGKLYEVIQAHTSQSDWTPDVVPALFRRLGAPPDVVPEWVQPTGGHDAYNAGDRVTYNGEIYASNIDGNVWSPTVHGWTKE